MYNWWKLKLDSLANCTNQKIWRKKKCKFPTVIHLQHYFINNPMTKKMDLRLQRKLWRLWEDLIAIRKHPSNSVFTNTWTVSPNQVTSSTRLESRANVPHKKLTSARLLLLNTSNNFYFSKRTIILYLL